MDATIRISDQPARTTPFPKGFLAGMNLSLLIERNKRGDGQSGLTQQNFKAHVQHNNESEPDRR